MLNERIIMLVAEVETKRLLLRPHSVNDCYEFYKMESDPNVMKYIGKDAFSDTYSNWKRNYFKDMNDTTVCDYENLSVIERSTNNFIGTCAVNYSEFLAGIELGYRFCKKVWGSGFATEASIGYLKKWFDCKPLCTVIAKYHPENKSSELVLKKLGFIQIGTKHIKYFDIDYPVLELTKKRFEEHLTKRFS